MEVIKRIHEFSANHNVYIYINVDSINPKFLYLKMGRGVYQITRGVSYEQLMDENFDYVDRALNEMLAAVNVNS